MRNNNNIVGEPTTLSKTSSVLPSNRFPVFISSSKEPSLVKKYSSISISSQSKLNTKKPLHIKTNPIISTIHHDIQSLQNQTNNKPPVHQSHNSIHHNNNNNANVNASKHKTRQHNRNKPQLFYSTKTLHSTHSKCFSTDINEYHAYNTIHTMKNDNTYSTEQTLTKPNIIYEKIHLKTPQFPMKSKAVNNGITNANTSINTDIYVQQQNGKELIGKGSISNIKININEKFRRSLEKNRKWMDGNEDNDDNNNDIKRNRSVPDGKGNGKENEVKCLKEVINRMQKVIYMKDNEIEKLKGIISKRECVNCNCNNNSNAVKSKIEAIINKYNNNTDNNERINSLLNEIKCAVMED